eukprot:scaffold34005_cov63-Phaeocystis_antarctica.AAC.9
MVVATERPAPPRLPCDTQTLTRGRFALPFCAFDNDRLQDTPSFDNDRLQDTPSDNDRYNNEHGKEGC